MYLLCFLTIFAVTIVSRCLIWRRGDMLYWQTTLIYGYAQNVTKVSTASIMRLLQRKMIIQKRAPYYQLAKICGTDGNANSREKGWKSARNCVRESRYEVAILTGYSAKMTVQQRVALELMLAVSILHPFT